MGSGSANLADDVQTHFRSGSDFAWLGARRSRS
jgi:hypothetical protein